MYLLLSGKCKPKQAININISLNIKEINNQHFAFCYSLYFFFFKRKFEIKYLKANMKDLEFHLTHRKFGTKVEVN